jgi:hypothetical protein
VGKDIQKRREIAPVKRVKGAPEKDAINSKVPSGSDREAEAVAPLFEENERIPADSANSQLEGRATKGGVLLDEESSTERANGVIDSDTEAAEPIEAADTEHVLVEGHQSLSRNSANSETDENTGIPGDIAAPGASPVVLVSGKHANKTFSPALSPVWNCSHCQFTDVCPQFKPDNECAFNAAIANKTIETFSDILDLQIALVEEDVQRAQRSVFIEKLQGGVVSKETTNQMDSAFKKLDGLRVVLSDTEERARQAALSSQRLNPVSTEREVIVSIKETGKNTENSDTGTMISQIFGSLGRQHGIQNAVAIPVEAETIVETTCEPVEVVKTPQIDSNAVEERKNTDGQPDIFVPAGADSGDSGSVAAQQIDVSPCLQNAPPPPAPLEASTNATSLLSLGAPEEIEDVYAVSYDPELEELRNSSMAAALEIAKANSEDQFAEISGQSHEDLRAVKVQDVKQAPVEQMPDITVGELRKE